MDLNHQLSSLSSRALPGRCGLPRVASAVARDPAVSILFARAYPSLAAAASVISASTSSVIGGVPQNWS